MNEITILRDLAVVIIAAGIAALVFEHLRLSKILGYLLAGFLIGPYAFALVRNDATTQTLSDLGILFLMLSLGLEFNLRKLRRMGATAVVTAALDVVVMMWIGYELGRALGLGTVESIFLGAIISDSSTTILTKTLKDMDKMREKFANIIFSATIVEDVIAIAVIAMLTGVASTGTFQAAGILVGLARLVIFMIVLVVIGLLVVPRLLVHVAKFRSEELLVICVLALAFGISLLAVKLQSSLALGAFLIGAIAAESRMVGRVELLVAPFRHLFGAAFFIAVGMMIQPNLLARYPLAIFGIAALVIISKTVNCSLGAFLTGNDLRNSFRAGLGMAQICEFAFIIATLGLSLKVVSPAMYQVAVGVSVLTMLANPFVLRYADRLADAITRFIPRGALSNMHLYGQGVRRMASQYHDNPIRKTVRRSVWMILINMAFVAAIFIAAAYMAQVRPFHLPEFLTLLGGRKTAYWVGAVLLSLPFFVATARKMHALGMILAEIALPSATQTPSANNVRTLIAALMLFVGILGIALLTFVLSSTLLPSWNVVIAVLLLVALATWFGWRSLIKLYGRAQSAVQETFARDLPPPKPQAVPAMIGALMDRDLEAVDINSHSPAAGKAVQDLLIRTQTGATIVSIERGREIIINPDSGLRLMPGDKVLLLGSPDQTDAARKLLAGS
jgi:monovalent cation:H+ antiporter-2, CPA2 family